MSRERIPPKTRREMLIAAGGAATAGLAGCSSGGDGSDGGDGSNGGDGGDGNNSGNGSGGDGGGGTPAREEFVGRLKGIFPKDAQFNPFNPKNQAWQANEVIYDRLAYWDLKKKYWPQIAQSWSIPEKPKEGSKVTITLRNDPPHTWHNGDPVVAQDIVTNNRLGKAFDYSIWDYISDVAAKEKFTVEYTLSGTYNPDIVKSVLLKQGPIQVKHGLYKKNLEAIKGASTDDEKNSAKSELQSRSIGIDEVIANGPYKPVDATSKKLFCERYEDYVAVAEDDSVESINSVDYNLPNFPKYTLLFGSEDQEIPLFKSKKLDGSRAAPHIAQGGLPKQYDIHPFFNDLGESFGFNLNDDIFGRRNVRKAMAYIVDRKTVVKAMNPSSRSEKRIQLETPDSQTGMADPYAKDWLGDTYDKLQKYNNGKNTEKKLQKATKLLKEEGFTKDSGKWVKPDGSVWTPEIKAPSYWEKSMSPTVNILQRFGIKASLSVQDAGTYWGKTIPNGDFGAIGYIWIPEGGSVMAHPWNAYMGELKTETVVPDGQDNPLRIPLKVDIPKTIGDESSSTETVDINKLVKDLSKPLPEDEMKQKVKRAAWTFNQLIPNIQLRRHTTQMTVNAVDFKWPEKESRLDNKLLWQSFNITHGGFRAKWESEM